MKKNIFRLIVIATASSLLLTQSCNDKFLQLSPETELSNDNSLHTETELTLYLNNLYNRYILGHGSGWADAKVNPNVVGGSHLLASDFMTDNMVRYGNISSMMDNTFIPPNAGTSVDWTWENLRSVNYFIKNYRNALPAVNNDATRLNKYIGEAYFFKSMDYYRKLMLFGDVPWLSSDLNINSEQLYKPRDKRTVVADSLMKTIDLAVAGLEGITGRPDGRINQDMALFLKARIGLFEGSFRTYHNELSLQSTAKPFLEAAVDACEKIIASGRYQLYATGETPYWKLFTFKKDPNSDGNKEAILARVYDGTVVGHATQRYWDQNNSISGGRPAGGATRGLIDEYLCIDGKPIYTSGSAGSYTANPLFKGYDGLWSELENRDPRLKQTINYPGENRSLFNRTDGTTSLEKNGITYPRLSYNVSGGTTVTGYLPIKHWMGDRTENEATTNGQQTAIEFRYGEVLLMLAEAKAILGTLTQNDLDRTINLLRQRAGFDFAKYPSSKLELGNLPADPRLDEIYAAKLDYSVSPIIREIRRERRIEMVLEDRRYEDLMRWKAGNLMTVPLRGMKFTAEKGKLYDGTHTAKPIIALKEEVNKDIFLDNNGFIIAYPRSANITNGVALWADYRYYWPLPLYDLTLDGNQLVQNPGWLGAK
ncbi:RagB/SusD family nutrient uptake outer membrane protein [Sphingobacterium multivorum]|uniref:RagB/SusD family nutrient uptake outer membrane protein n=1 Tax=Sphingobacterium multivorum TaxID=28454 RepID=UPI0028A63418|nr:RagB/SusD family nutrient uptake outer membrane protein [Sphingobacterium multivorum]